MLSSQPCCIQALLIGAYVCVYLPRLKDLALPALLYTLYLQAFQQLLRRNPMPATLAMTSTMAAKTPCPPFKLVPTCAWKHQIASLLAGIMTQLQQLPVLVLVGSKMLLTLPRGGMGVDSAEQLGCKVRVMTAG
jgi:hypothetical protein